MSKTIFFGWLRSCGVIVLAAGLAGTGYSASSGAADKAKFVGLRHRDLDKTCKPLR